jgi:hypothetical protein
MTVPLHQRPSFRQQAPEHNALARDLGKLREQHGLLGCVLVSFSADRVGVNSSAVNEAMLPHMLRLGDQLLMAIDDGQFDSQLPEEK